MLYQMSYEVTLPNYHLQYFFNERFIFLLCLNIRNIFCISKLFLKVFLILDKIFCGLGENRTRDLLIMSQLLLTAELQGQFVAMRGFEPKNV
jgi:hypothetical protein